MVENGLYFGKSEFYDFIRAVGGQWNDVKERPLVCLLESSEHAGLFWAIPVGKLGHRDDKGKKRIEMFMAFPEDDIRSCYYHVGKTDVESIFFISDVVPITEDFIEKEYIFKATQNIYIIKNKVLIGELQRKLKRVLSWENSRPNTFRQHITDIKNQLLL